jgi:hypothetical protein
MHRFALGLSNLTFTNHLDDQPDDLLLLFNQNEATAWSFSQNE